jgi:hypothetical protein
LVSGQNKFLWGGLIVFPEYWYILCCLELFVIVREDESLNLNYFLRHSAASTGWNVDRKSMVLQPPIYIFLAVLFSLS